MNSLSELCDIIEENPIILSEKLPWICQQCPQSKLLLSQSPRVSRSHLSSVLAVARLLAKNLDTTENHAKSVVLNFLKALRASFHRSFWSQSFTLESISAFYISFLSYVSCMSLEFGTTVSELTREALSCSGSDKDQAIARAFLIALSQNFPSIQHSDGAKLIAILLHQFAVVNQASITETSGVVEGSGDSSSRDGYIESLEKQEIAFKLIAIILGKVKVDCELHDQVRSVSQSQLQSMSAFLKSRRWDLDKQDPVLKTRVNAQLFVYEAAAKMEFKSLLSLETDGRKKLVLEALTLLLNAADTCLTSVWWKMEACEQLFSSLLSGIAKIAVAVGGQSLRLLFIRLKPLVLAVCSQPGTWVRNQGNTLESVFKISREIIESGWAKDRASVDTFIMGLASIICERNDEQEQVDREKQVPVVQLNVVQLLADISVAIKKPEVVDMIFPFFIKSLEDGDASTPWSLRLQLLDAVSRIATLGFEKSYRVTVVLMTRCYLSKVPTVGSVERKTSAPKSRTEHLETLAAEFLTIASGLMDTELRSEYRLKLLSLCSDVGLASESESGGSGAEFLGPLLPAVAEICSDFDPTSNVEPSLLKLFRNLWFYIALLGLAPPILKTPLPEVKKTKNSVNSGGRVTTLALQAVGGPYMWNTTWALSVQRISQGTPPLVVSSVKWLEDGLELNALHNSYSFGGTENKKIALAQRTALSIALGGRVEVSALNTISGQIDVNFMGKATYLLAVTLLEVLRFISNGGIRNGCSRVSASRSAFSCIFEYLKSPNLTPAVSQCLTAIVHRAFEAAVSWLEDRVSLTGNDASIRDSTLYAHACFLIKSMSQRDEHIRDISVNLLIQIRDKFPQVLWSSSCLDSLIYSVHDNAPSTVVNDPAWTVAVRSLYYKVVREWIIISLSHAPCLTQGLLQDKLCKSNTLERTQTTIDVVSLLTEMKIGTGKNESWSGMKTSNIPAVMAAAAAVSGANLKVSEAFNSEVLGAALVNAMYKCNHIGKTVGMLSLANNSGNGTLVSNSVRLLQQFVNTAKKRGEVNNSQFREICSQATAILLLNLQAGEPKANVKDFSQLLRLLCWCPAYMLTPEALETGIFIWTWLVSAVPHMGSLVLAELVDAWIWTIDAKRGLFASDARYSDPAAKLRPQLAPGEQEGPPQSDPVDQIVAHRLWLGFFIDRYEVVRHNSNDQLLLFGRLLHRSTNLDWCFTHHPAATGTFFSLMLLGLKFCSCQRQGNMHKFSHGLQLLEDRIYRTSLGWFSRQPEWYDVNIPDFCQSEAQAVSVFAHFLSKERSDVCQCDSKGKSRDSGDLINATEQYHPVWGEMDNYAVGKENRQQLLLMLCQHETDRLDVWAQPVSAKSPYSQLKISSAKWKEHARTAFSVDPRIAISLASRFLENIAVKSEVIHLVQAHIVDLHKIPEALPYFVTPKTVRENSVLLQQLPHFAACSITQALEFLTPAYKGHPRVMAYVLRVLEFYPSERVTFFMPQLVQSLRYDEGRLVEGYLLRAAQRSDIFAHILIWHLQGESAQEIAKDGASDKNASFQALLLEVRKNIIDSFTPKALDLFSREFDFFEKITSISGALFPLPKEERRAGIKRELEKITMQGEDLYLPTAPNKLVKGIQVDSGIPLQSAAKVPIMITFNVVDRDGNHNDVKPQACIFKVGDDCRQDVLALQVISLLRDIFQAAGLNLYLFPYGVLPTGAGRGIIEVVPNTRSRSQMGETTDGGLYEIFRQTYGPVGSPTFETARQNFLTSLAGYAVASLLLQPKDRHNGNLLFDEVGRLVHIDFGFILETSPGGNMRFESAHFKLSHEMTQLVDPSGVMKSETWHEFVSLCVKGYLAARRYMDGIISTVEMMVDSGLPCFNTRRDPIEKLRKRFHPEMNEREAARFMVHACTDAYNKWTTTCYDLIQYLQQGIDK